jgi:hypothetical protein
MITKKQYIYTHKKQYTHKKSNNNNTLIKHIYIKNDAGFGNKVFDLIFAIYLYNLYNKNNNKCIINYVLIKSLHEKNNDPKLYNIFSKSKTKINFITENQYKFINNKHKLLLLSQNMQDMKYILNIKKLPKYEDLSQYNEIINNFKLVYQMYKTFSQDDKDIFTMNTKILTNKSILNKIISKPYSLVHIRYGDKLYYLSKIINKPDIDISTLLNKENKNNHLDQFILYTPEYYIDKINELLETTPNNMNIYIITDSANIVKEFIMNNSTQSFMTNPRVVLLDTITWWDSFYLLYYASNIILSSSTFCFTGAYFNKKNAKCELLLYHHNKYSSNIEPSEYSISPYWKIVSDRKYILNYNVKLSYEILKFKYNWKY